MQRTRPLKDHPEFSIVESRGWHEYRVQTGTTTRANLRYYWLDALFAIGAAYTWRSLATSNLSTIVFAVVLLCYSYSRLTQVLWESIVVIPSLGLQLETHRGIADISLLATRTFVPWSALEDVLINEGIRGWDIRYYLIAVTRATQGSIQLEVAFENVLPRFHVLLEVYNGIQDALDTENPRNGI